MTPHSTSSQARSQPAVADLVLVRRFHLMTIERLILGICALLTSSTAALAVTSVYHYGSDEYVTIVSGLSPDGKYAVTAHGEGDNGYDHFHIYLTDAVF